jgi:hypothetical protein
VLLLLLVRKVAVRWIFRRSRCQIMPPAAPSQVVSVTTALMHVGMQRHMLSLAPLLACCFLLFSNWSQGSQLSSTRPPLWQSISKLTPESASREAPEYRGAASEAQLLPDGVLAAEPRPKAAAAGRTAALSSPLYQYAALAVYPGRLREGKA